MSTEAKIIAALALLIAVLGGLWWYGEHRYNLGLAAGKAEIQTAWDTDKAAIQAVTDKAIAQATAERDTALEANGVIRDTYETKLSAANASAQSLAASLRDARSRLAANSGPVPKAGDRSGTAATAPASGVGQLDAATAAALSECAATRASYEALIAELKPQL